MKKAVKIIAIVVGCLAVLVIGGTLIMSQVLPPPAPVSVGEIDLNGVEDGTYEGEYTSGAVSVQVIVEVADHAITDINIKKHDNGLGKKAETIVSDIIDTQSVQVDAITGATVSSNVIRKAVEVAVQPSNQEE